MLLRRSQHHPAAIDAAGAHARSSPGCRSSTTSCSASCDLSWKLAREASKHSFALWSIVLAIVPLLIPALLAYRQRGPGRSCAAATRAWPIAALIVFLVSASGASATPLHAFQGITVPLAVLAVQGVHEGRAGGAFATTARSPSPRWPCSRFPPPRRALQRRQGRLADAPATPTSSPATSAARSTTWPTDRDPGGVLTRSYLGAAVPGKTGRRTLVGDCLWSEPHCHARAGHRGAVRRPLSPRSREPSFAAPARASCSPTATRAPTSGGRSRPLIVDVRRFGCATVFETEPAGFPLANSGRIAAMRLFALRGANSVERNEADAILDGHRRAHA